MKSNSDLIVERKNKKPPFIRNRSTSKILALASHKAKAGENNNTTIHIPMVNEIRNNYILVKERMDLVKKLVEFKSNFQSKDLFKFYFNFATHPYEHYEGLIIYLTLTCFDILGQPDEWLEFNSWLSAKNKQQERDVIFENTKELDFEARIKAIHRCYLDIYSVKSSFFRFLREKITDSDRNRLFESITAHIVTKEPLRQKDGSITIYGGDEYLLSPEQKEKALFKGRNSFTHKGISWGNGTNWHSRNQFLNFEIMKINSGLEGDLDEIINSKTTTPVFSELKNGKRVIYETCDWPNVLIEVVTDFIDRNAHLYGFNESELKHHAYIPKKTD